MQIWLVIPVKPLHESKSRLAAVLAADHRRALTACILRHELAIAEASTLISGTIVVTRDPTLLDDVRQQGAIGLREETVGLNAALERARREVVQRGADALLVLPADLPFMTVKDIEHLVEPLYQQVQVVLAPSPDGGTNALLVRPPTLLEFAFGPQSFARHRLMAQQMGLRYQPVVSQTLAFDLDWPEDWELLRRVYPDLAGMPMDMHGELDAKTVGSWPS